MNLGKKLNQLFTRNWREKIISVVLAFLLWFMIKAQDVRHTPQMYQMPPPPQMVQSSPAPPKLEPVLPPSAPVPSKLAPVLPHPEDDLPAPTESGIDPGLRIIPGTTGL